MGLTKNKKCPDGATGDLWGPWVVLGSGVLEGTIVKDPERLQSWVVGSQGPKFRLHLTYLQLWSDGVLTSDRYSP